MSCGYRWLAPYLLPPGAPRNVRVPVRGARVMVEQECALAEGHDGPHRSSTNVIHAATEKTP